jgi:hypothetical protein
MNQSIDLQQPAQLYGHSAHAGGWPKLGWQCAEADDSADDTWAADETEPRAFS